MTHEEQLALCRQFNLGDPQSCVPLGGTRNQNFRLTTSRGQFVIRDRYIRYRETARVAFDHAAITFLHTNGAAVVPPLPTIIGESFWQAGDRFWELFPFIPSRHFQDGNLTDLRALASALAKFHSVGRRFPSTFNKLAPRGETDPRELRELISKLRPDAFAALHLYESWITSAVNDLSDALFASLPSTLIHGDIQPANILIPLLPLPGTPGRGQGRGVSDVPTKIRGTSQPSVQSPDIPNQINDCLFIDLDWCSPRPRIYDLAFAILLCCSTHATPIDGSDIWSLTQPPNVQPNLVQQLLQSYNDSTWPLEPRELNALHPQILLSWCHCRLAGAMKIDPSRRAEFLSRPPHDSDFALVPSPGTPGEG